MKRTLIVPTAFALILGLTTCKKKLIPGIYEGAPVPMGNGTIHCWSAFDDKGNPTALGMSLTDGALENLPDSMNHPSGNDHSNVFAAELPPDIVSKTPFLHVAANWNPKGHVPNGIYNKAHFDFHFYMIGSAERKQIPDYGADSTKFKIYPPAGYLPSDFFHPGGGEPEMGAHWISLNAPELQPGGEFTETWVYGTYDGKVTFFEPMVTYSLLKNLTEDYVKNIPRMPKVQKSGFYPTLMRLKHKDGLYVICLENFEYRKAE